MIAINYRDNKKIKKDIKPLYISAFPLAERPPVNMYFHSFDKEGSELFGFYEDSKFIGFISTKLYKDICYIFFLAVSPEYRNQGYGTKMLNTMKEIYKDYVLLLCYEEVNEKYKDFETRKRREEFYIRNGFKKNPLITNEFGVIYQTAIYGDRYVSFEEYKAIFVLGFSDYALKYLKEIK